MLSTRRRQLVTKIERLTAAGACPDDQHLSGSLTPILYQTEALRATVGRPRFGVSARDSWDNRGTEDSMRTMRLWLSSTAVAVALAFGAPALLTAQSKPANATGQCKD